MRIHLIAIGGAIMHQIAITMKHKGYQVTGSDDVIQEPSKSRLEKEGLLPEKLGFHAENVSKNLDLVILGMHAKFDNPELTRAMELGVKVLSFPEFIYENSKDKTRVVIAGSHGKTSITSMIMHCLKENNIDFDYMVGSSVAGFEHSVRLSDAPIIIIEGDEYLASPINKEPKFIYYKAHLATLSGIEWDHINVFKTENIYFDQFKKLVNSMNPDSTLFYYDQEKIKETVSNLREDVKLVPYKAIPYSIDGETFVAECDGINYPLELFGRHNMENIEAARNICISLGLSNVDFFKSIAHFSGAGRRLELLVDDEKRVVYKDFAHSPSKLKATVQAVKEKYQSRKLIACFEMHTFSTLSKDFLPQYRDSMKDADVAIVFIDRDVVEKKGNGIFTSEEIKTNFNREDIIYITDKKELESTLALYAHEKPVYLMMTSGAFGGIDLTSIGTSTSTSSIVQKTVDTEVIEIQPQTAISELYQTNQLNAVEFREIYFMLNLCYLGFILAPIYFYFKERKTTTDDVFNIIAIALNFQILSTAILLVGILFTTKTSIIFLLAILLNIYFINKAISQLSLQKPIRIPSGILAVFPRIDKA